MDGRILCPSLQSSLCRRFVDSWSWGRTASQHAWLRGVRRRNETRGVGEVAWRLLEALCARPGVW